MRLRVIVFALVATAVAVGLVVPLAGAKPKPPKPPKPPKSTTTVAPTTTTVEPTTTTVEPTTTTVEPTTTTVEPTTTTTQDPNVYLTGTAPVTDQGLILYGEGIFTGLPIPGGDPDVVRDCPAGYTMDFEQSTFTETGGTDILTVVLNTDFGTPIIRVDNSTLTEGEPTTATLEYSIACVPSA
jgi:hypothetical protein